MTDIEYSELDLCYWPQCSNECLAWDIPLCQRHLVAAWKIRQAQEADRKWKVLHANRLVSPGQPAALQGLVYYVQLKHGDIKIGCTVNLGSRMAQLRLSLTDVLAAEPGSFKLEKRRHREFDRFRRDPHREDFEAAPDLLRHAADIRGQHGDPAALYGTQMEHNRAADRASLGQPPTPEGKPASPARLEGLR